MTQPEVLDVSAGLIWSEAKFLAGQRPATDRFAGFWELPGGKWQSGENGLQALCRELLEELGIKVLSARFLRSVRHVYAPGPAVNLHFFEVTVYSGVPSALEGQNLAWIAPTQIADYEFLPADSAILADLGAGRLG